MMTCTGCEIEWNGWMVGTDCPDCGAPGRPLKASEFEWGAGAATTRPLPQIGWKRKWSL